MTPSSAAGLTPIAIVDARGGGPVRHALEGRARAGALRDECIGWLPRVVAGAMPIADSVTRRWLERSRSTYVAEVRAVAAVGCKGCVAAYGPVAQQERAAGSQTPRAEAARRNVSRRV